MKKALIYKLDKQIGTVYVHEGALKIEGGESINKLIASVQRTDKTASLNEFVESLPQRLRSQVFAEVIDE